MNYWNLIVLFGVFGLLPIPVFTLFRNERSHSILAHDGAGGWTALFGLILAIAGGLLPNFLLGDPLLARPGLVAVGGFVFGFGILMWIDDSISDRITNRKNIPVELFVIAGLLILYAVWMEWANVWAAITQIITNGQLVSLLALIVGIMLVVVGIIIRRYQKTHPEGG